MKTLAALLIFLAPPAAAQDRMVSLSPPETAGVRLLKDGDYLPALLEAVGQARSAIVLSAFFFRTTGTPPGLPDRVLAAFEAAAGRGVQVTAILERGPEGDNVSRDNAATAERLRSDGIRVCLDAPERTTHAKLVVIDGRLLFVGSHNLTQSALKYNREVSVRIDSPRLAAEALRYLGELCP
jgi:phosphatidylserine/phosphatidylglycerophosphate/cardiolipin synthase-like enzyme